MMHFMDCIEINLLCWNLISGERKAHPPLVEAAEDSHGFRVVVTENHLNRTATSGCVARLVGLYLFLQHAAVLETF
jgi:hypothetical protein